MGINKGIIKIIIIITISSYYLLRGKFNLIILIICIELLILAIGILFLFFSFLLDDLIGSLITLILLPLAGCESAIILAIIIKYYPKRGTITIN